MVGLKDVYHKDTYAFDTLPESYWAATANLQDFPTLTEHTDADVAIIGGGITGLVAALRLAKEFGKSVVVLEAGQIGWGASGRAGGFNSGMASKLSLGGLRDTFGLDATLDFAAAQSQATELVYETAKAENIDMDATGHGVFVAAMSKRAALDLKEQARIYQDILGKKTEFLGREEFQDRVHDGDFVKGGLHIPGGGGIHPLKYTLGIAAAAKTNGARIFAQSRVTGWKKQDNKHVLTSPLGSVTASRVLVATNAYASDHLVEDLDRRMLPLISGIIVTRPLSDSELADAEYTSHTPVYTADNKLFYYRLLPDNRFLIGGRGDTVGSNSAGARNLAWLERRFRSLFPKWKNVDVSYRWNGLVCVTRRGVPAVGCMIEDSTIGYAFGCHGSGLNNATWMGHEQATIMASRHPEKETQRLPEIVRALPPRVLGPRRAIINAALMSYSAIDAWNNRPF